MQERLAERRTAEAVRRSRRAARVWLVVAVIGALAWVAFGSPLFVVSADKIAITLEARVPGDGGAQVVDAAAVRAAVEPFAGERLTRLDVSAIEDATLAVPGVRSVDVTRVWPHGLALTVYEKVAVAAVPSPGEGFVLVDADGGALRTVAKAPGDLPVVIIPVGEGNARTLDAVLGVVAALPSELASQVQGIRAASVDSVEFDLRDGLTVTWGSAADTALKSQVLLLLLDSGTADSAARIDVSAPELPIVVDAPSE